MYIEVILPIYFLWSMYDKWSMVSALDEISSKREERRYIHLWVYTYSTSSTMEARDQKILLLKKTGGSKIISY
jgi:hypothetical protein